MQWSLPALRAAGGAAEDLKVAAAGFACWSAFAWPPVEEHCAWLPGVPEAALFWEAWKHHASWLFHELYSNM